MQRGTCDFLTKTVEVQKAGGIAVIVGNLYPYIIRMVSRIRVFALFLNAV